MGNKPSSVVNKTENPTNVVEQISGEGGHIVNNKEIVLNDSMIAEEEASLEALDSDTDSDYSDSDEEDEDDEELLERLRILEDARKLKQLAVAFLHPEAPVVADGTACARCYFDRASAPEQESAEDAEERVMALADAAALKKLAVDYMHPERGVETSDPSATARCYFDRASAPEQESVEDMEERMLILEDVQKLRDAARQYLHPELGVKTSDPTATARCYFDRASAPEQESVEDMEERAMALADAAALKKLAVDYMHPEVGVVTSDPTATARCYFDRASAPEQESVEDAEERAMALADAAALKKLAVDYMHPEIGVVTSDPTATARCYFDRASAPQEVGSISTTTPKKATTIAKKSVTKTIPAPVIKTVDSAVNTSGIVKSVSAVQLYGLDEDNCDPSF